MFELESAIKQWTKGLAANPGLEDGQRAELEACLRDEVADLVRRGRSPEEAFRQVAAEMGKPDEMGAEFFKVYAKRRFGAPSWKQARFAPALYWNYAKIALRKIRRQKGYSLINVAGLAVGLACCALMMLWVRQEKSFDMFHANRDSIYRVIKETAANGGKTMLDARTYFPLGPAIRDQVPEILDFCRFQGYEGRDLKYGDKLVTLTKNFGTADPSFFEMFSFALVKGDPKTALNDADSIVLSESAARKIFGAEEPMGKVLTKPGHRGDFKVRGVMKDIPENSHIQVDSLIGIRHDAPWHDVGENDWESLFYYMYVRLAPGASAASAGPKIAAVLNAKVPQLKASILLQPLRDVHLRSSFQWDMDNFAQGSQSTLDIFTLAALGVLLLAMINFMNLATARSANRAKEVGLRKVSGARRSEVMAQFLGESVLLAFLGLGLALFLVYLGLPLFNDLAGKSIPFSGLFDPLIVLGLLGGTLVTGLLAGTYPSVFLSAFQPSRVLKGSVASGGRGQAVLRKALVVLQFALTLFFVMGTAVVGRQLKYVREKNLGIDTHNVVVGPAFFRDFQAARSAFLANPNVINLTLAAPPQKEQRGLRQVSWEGKALGDEAQFFPVSADPDYLETFHIGLAEGRFFSRDVPTDATGAVVLNQAAVRAMGMTAPLGKPVTIGRQTYTVIGVVKDFHQSSLHRPIEPMILRYDPQHWQMCIRLGPDNVPETIEFLRTTAKKHVAQADLRIDFQFLDDTIDGFYAADRKIEAVLGLFTAIALFTACLGLLGLASFLAEKRTKEIGIRKILGAPVPGLILLQTREFSKWILAAGFVAGPLAYLASGRWLQGFAYHISPSLGMFVMSVLVTLVVALLAVGYQSVRAARANPVEALRHE